MSTSLKIFISSVLVICLAIFTVLFLEPADESKEHDDLSHEKTDTNRDREALIGEVATLREELRSMRQDQNILSHELSKANESINAKNLDSKEQRRVPEDRSTKTKPILSDEERLEREARFLEEEVVPELDHRLSMESRDRTWSKQAERMLLDSFNKSEIQGSKIVNVDCRSTFCRLEIEHDDMKSRMKYTDKVFETLPWSKSQMFLHTRNFRNWHKNEGSGNLVTLVYYSRGGNPLPPTPPPP